MLTPDDVSAIRQVVRDELQPLFAKPAAPSPATKATTITIDPNGGFKVGDLHFDAQPDGTFYPRIPAKAIEPSTYVDEHGDTKPLPAGLVGVSAPYGYGFTAAGGMFIKTGAYDNGN